MDKLESGKNYQFSKAFELDRPYPLKSGTIPKGTVVRFEEQNMGYARFKLLDEELVKKLGLKISLKPKTAFRILIE